MGEQKRSARARVATLGLGTAVMAGVVFGLGGGTAGATYAACSGSQIFDVPGMQGFELYDVSGYDVRTFDLGFTLESGTYDITASSFDGYPGRKDVPLAEQETSERWWAEFLDADGNVVGALPGPTTDLPDDTDVAEVVDRFDDVVLSGTATQVRFVLIRPVADPGSGGHDATTTAAGTGTAELSPQGNRGWQPPAQEWPKWSDDEHPVDDPPPVHEEKPAPKKSLNLVHVGCVGFDRHQTPTTTTPSDPGTPTTTRPADPAPTTTTPVSIVTTTTTPATTSTIPIVVSPSTLPFTGDHTGLLAAVGASIVAVGLALVVRARRMAA